VAAAGPIAGLIGGAVTGGVVGGLIDLGIPEANSRDYQNHINEGKTVWSMPVDEENGGAVSKILRECGAISVEIHR